MEATDDAIDVRLGVNPLPAVEDDMDGRPVIDGRDTDRAEGVTGAGPTPRAAGVRARVAAGVRGRPGVLARATLAFRKAGCVGVSGSPPSRSPGLDCFRLLGGRMRRTSCSA